MAGFTTTLGPGRGGPLPLLARHNRVAYQHAERLLADLGAVATKEQQLGILRAVYQLLATRPRVNIVDPECSAAAWLLAQLTAQLAERARADYQQTAAIALSQMQNGQQHPGPADRPLTPAERTFLKQPLGPEVQPNWDQLLRPRRRPKQEGRYLQDTLETIRQELAVPFRARFAQLLAERVVAEDACLLGLLRLDFAAGERLEQTLDELDQQTGSGQVGYQVLEALLPQLDWQAHFLAGCQGSSQTDWSLDAGHPVNSCQFLWRSCWYARRELVIRSAQLNNDEKTLLTV